MPMSGRVRQATGVTGGLLLLLTGCTLGTGSDNSDNSPTFIGTPPPPIGSISRPRPVDCVDGMTYQTVDPHGRSSSVSPPAPTPSTSVAASSSAPASASAAASGSGSSASPSPSPSPTGEDVNI